MYLFYRYYDIAIFNPAGHFYVICFGQSVLAIASVTSGPIFRVGVFVRFGSLFGIQYYILKKNQCI